MEKMKNIFASPKKIAIVAVVAVLIICVAVFAASKVNAAGGKSRGIGMDKSIAVALHDAGFQENEVTGLRASLDHDDGIDTYEVTFIANGYEYDYEIKAADGEILDCTVERLDGQMTSPESGEDIGLDKAKASALSHAGLKASAVEFTKTKTDYDDDRGVKIYELEFVSGNTEYDYEINAVTGAVLEYSKEKIRTSGSASTSGNAGSSTSGSTSSGSNSSGSSSSGSSSSSQTSNYIGVDKAKSIALKDAGVSASAVKFTKAKLDRDDGKVRYEIEFFTHDTEYEYEIDPVSGQILGRDWEHHDGHDDHDDHDHDWDDDWDD